MKFTDHELAEAVRAARQDELRLFMKTVISYLEQTKDYNAEPIEGYMTMIIENRLKKLEQPNNINPEPDEILKGV